MTEQALARMIRQRLGECSPAERKVARAVLADYPSAALDTVARLAHRAGVSGPTVVRFATRLGFQGYPDLQRVLRAELDRPERGGSEHDSSGSGGPEPNGSAAEGSGPEPPTEMPLPPWVSDTADALTRAVAQIPPSEMKGAVGLLADRHRQVYVVGGLFAGYLHQLLAGARTGVHRVSGPPSQAAACVADLSSRDVLVVFDLPPYEPVVTALARYANRQHAKVVVFTAGGLSPAAAHAEVVLPCDAARALAPVMALLEAVAAEVLDALGKEAAKRRDRAQLIAAELALS